MVRALVRLYALVFINSIRLGIGAASMASVRIPSKLMIKTRFTLTPAGVGVTRTVAVAAGVTPGGSVVAGGMVAVDSNVAVTGMAAACSVGPGSWLRPVGVGAGGRELPHKLGIGAQPASRNIRVNNLRRLMRCYDRPIL